MKYLEGDEVRITDKNGSDASVGDMGTITEAKDGIYTVKVNRWVGSKKLFFTDSHLELVKRKQQPKDKLIQELIDRANEGRKALEGLFEIMPDQVQIKSEQDENIWKPLKSLKKLEYRIKENKPVETYKTSEGWLVEYRPDRQEIRVGCKIFIAAYLRNHLRDLIKNNLDRSGVLIATKAGIKCGPNMLSWEESEKLYEYVIKNLEEK